MVALHDTSHEFDASRALRQTIQRSSRVNRGGRTFFGSVLLISAIGLWLVPVGAGDAAMQLVKLGVSLFLGGLGALFLSSIAQTDTAPEIQFDTKNRELRVVSIEYPSRKRVETRHKLDDLTDVSLQDKLFTARAENSGLRIVVPVTDKHAETTLRAALNLAA